MIIRTFREVRTATVVARSSDQIEHMVEGTITISLPMPPNLANERGHSRWSSAAKKRYFEKLDYRQNCGLIPAPPSRPLPNVILSAWMGLGARMDDDNAKLRAYKWPADYLRTRGYIAADDRVHCMMIDPVREIVSAPKRGLVITIEPMYVDPALTANGGAQP